MDFCSINGLRVPPLDMKRFLLLLILWVTTCYIYFCYKECASIHWRSVSKQDLLDKSTIKYFMSVKLKIDHDTRLNETELFKKMVKDSNLPLSYRSNKTFALNECSKFPSLYDLEFNNIYWQKLSAFKANFYLLNAYYDDRVRVGRLPLVRILGMVNKISPPTIYCQFWYDNVGQSIVSESAMFSKVSYTYMWLPNWGNYEDNVLQPFIISCPVAKFSDKYYVPASVSLVGKRCDILTNNLKVIYRRPKKKEDFAVCVKGLDFLYQDISVRLVEWIELLKILGAKKIFMYDLEIHPNVSKVLSYYVKRNVVELNPLTLPGEQPNLPGFRHLYLKSKVVAKRQNELIPYNDCLYKNLYSYKYIALLDTDEVIMPLAHDSWKDMMTHVVNLALKETKFTRASYNFRNVYFLDESLDGKEKTQERGVPKYLHMLGHLYRSKNYTKPFLFVKCFHEVERVISLHNHFPLNCFGSCTTYSVNTSVAHLQHYRRDCVDALRNKCSHFKSLTTRDTSILRFKDEVIKRTTEVLRVLGFFKDFH